MLMHFSLQSSYAVQSFVQSNAIIMIINVISDLVATLTFVMLRFLVYVNAAWSGES